MTGNDAKSEIIKQQIERDGFSVVSNVVPDSEVEKLIDDLEKQCSGAYSARRRGGTTYAIRNLLKSLPSALKLAQSPAINSLVEAVLGPGAFPVLGLLFDKTPEANWKVAWHQDTTIAVEKRVDVPGFGPWSIKEGVQHVQPPSEILDEILTVRVQLDECDEDNGPLQVLPGSHREGKMSAARIASWVADQTPVVCSLNSGGVLLMRPLLLHASSAAKRPLRRRVIHLEYSAHPLPSGLQWHTVQK